MDGKVMRHMSLSNDVVTLTYRTELNGAGICFNEVTRVSIEVNIDW
jgi:hypothetical protein